MRPLNGAMARRIRVNQLGFYALCLAFVNARNQSHCLHLGAGIARGVGIRIHCDGIADGRFLVNEKLAGGSTAESPAGTPAIGGATQATRGGAASTCSAKPSARAQKLCAGSQLCVTARVEFAAQVAVQVQVYCASCHAVFAPTELRLSASRAHRLFWRASARALLLLVNQSYPVLARRVYYRALFIANPSNALVPTRRCRPRYSAQAGRQESLSATGQPSTGISELPARFIPQVKSRTAEVAGRPRLTVTATRVPAPRPVSARRVSRPPNWASGSLRTTPAGDKPDAVLVSGGWRRRGRRADSARERWLPSQRRPGLRGGGRRIARRSNWTDDNAGKESSQ